MTIEKITASKLYGRRLSDKDGLKTFREKEYVALSSLENATLEELTELSPLVRVMNEKSIRDEQTIFEESERVLGLKNRLDKLLVSLEKAETLSTGYCLDREINEVKEIVREMQEVKP